MLETSFVLGRQNSASKLGPACGLNDLICLPACTFQFFVDSERPKDRAYKRHPCKHAFGAASLEPMQKQLSGGRWLLTVGGTISSVAFRFLQT